MTSLTLKVEFEGDLRRIRDWQPDADHLSTSAARLQSMTDAIRSLFELDEGVGMLLKYADPEGDLCTLTEHTLHDLLSSAAEQQSKVLKIVAAKAAPAAAQPVISQEVDEFAIVGDRGASCDDVSPDYIDIPSPPHTDDEWTVEGDLSSEDRNRPFFDLVKASAREACEHGGVIDDAAFQRWLRNFHSERSDVWFSKNYSRLRNAFRPVWDEVTTPKDQQSARSVTQIPASSSAAPVEGQVLPTSFQEEGTEAVESEITHVAQSSALSAQVLESSAVPIIPPEELNRQETSAEPGQVLHAPPTSGMPVAQAIPIVQAIPVANAVPISRGTRVLIQNLQNSPNLNGREGVCQEFISDNGRWNVRLQTGELKALKSENLIVLSPRAQACTRSPSILESVGRGLRTLESTVQSSLNEVQSAVAPVGAAVQQHIESIETRATELSEAVEHRANELGAAVQQRIDHLQTTLSGQSSTGTQPEAAAAAQAHAEVARGDQNLADAHRRFAEAVTAHVDPDPPSPRDSAQDYEILPVEPAQQEPAMDVPSSPGVHADAAATAEQDLADARRRFRDAVASHIEPDPPSPQNGDYDPEVPVVEEDDEFMQKASQLADMMEAEDYAVSRALLLKHRGDLTAAIAESFPEPA